MWAALSNLGDAALTLPLAAVCCVWLATSLHGWRIAVSWLMLLAAAMLTVALTKILHAGCGVEIRAIDFRMISGHTMLAASVWPMVCLLALHDGWHIRSRAALLSGLILAAVIATARVFDNAHTASEVIAGWALGAFVTLLLLARWKDTPIIRPWWRLPAACSMLVVSGIAYGHHSPIQAAIERYSPFLCGRFL